MDEPLRPCSFCDIVTDTIYCIHYKNYRKICADPRKCFLILGDQKEEKA